MYLCGMFFFSEIYKTNDTLNFRTPCRRSRMAEVLLSLHYGMRQGKTAPLRNAAGEDWKEIFPGASGQGARNMIRE